MPEARHFWAVQTDGQKKFKVKDIYLQIQQLMILLIGPKSYLDIATVAYTREIGKLPSSTEEISFTLGVQSSLVLISSG